MDPLFTSQTPLLLAMGMSAYVGLLHLWYTRRSRGPHGWVAIWALVAVAFQAARLAQLHTRDPLVAVIAARWYTGMAPLLIGSLCAFVQSLSGRPASRPRALAFLAANVVLSLAMLGTDWFVSSRTYLEQDWLGASFHSVHVEPSMLVLPVYMLGAYAWMVRPIRRSPELSPTERAALFTSLGLYAAMGLFSVASSFDWIATPGVVEYGPVVLGVCLSFLLVHRQRRLEDSLQSLVDARTADAGGERGALARPDRERAHRHLRLRSARERHHAQPAPAPDPGQAAGRGGPLGGRVLAGMRQCLTRGEVISGEVRYTSSFGRTADIRVLLAPVRGENGDVTGALGLVEDITERRTLEEGLRRSQKLESIGQLAAGIAHEINNPMAFVRTNLAVLREEWHALRKEIQDEGRAPALQGRFSECESLIDESLEGIERTIAIARDMREFAHSGNDPRADGGPEPGGGGLRARGGRAPQAAHADRRALRRRCRRCGGPRASSVRCSST